MDARRAIILIGIAVISYMLVLQWNEDYGKRPVNQNVMTSQSAVSSTPDVSVNPAASQDIPDVSSDEPQLEPVSNVASTDLIEVQTDVLDIRINPQGGDIVYAALKAFPQSLENKDIPFVLLEQNAMRTFVAQSGLVGQDGIDKDGRALFSASSTQYQLADGDDELVVTLSTVKNNVAINKVFKFKRGLYLVDVGYDIHNQSANPWKANFYAQFKRDRSADPSSMESMGMASYLGAAVTRPSERYYKIDFDDIEESRYKETIQGGWAAFLQHYFLSAWVPNAEQTHTYNTRKAGNNYIVGYYDEALNVAPGEQSSTFTSLYLGPKDQDRLAEISENLELTVDYGWLWWVAQPLFWLLQVIHSIVGNWGWSIIFLTILVKLAFFPLSATSYRSMANMRRVAPKLTALREQYGEDRQKLSQEMMGLYK